MIPTPAPHPRRRPHLRLAAFGATLSLLLVASPPLLAQGTGRGDGIRLGITFGGISTAGFVIEYVDGQRGLEVNIGTWSFRDVSVAVTGKEYFGAGSLHPFVGIGIWLVGSAPPSEGERTGLAAVLHAPVGADWRIDGDHFTGLAINVSRALAVRRTDPDDDLPLNRRLVPLPSAYYRWRN